MTPLAWLLLVGVAVLLAQSRFFWAAGLALLFLLVGCGGVREAVVFDGYAGEQVVTEDGDVVGRERVAFSLFGVPVVIEIQGDSAEGAAAVCIGVGRAPLRCVKYTSAGFDWGPSLLPGPGPRLPPKRPQGPPVEGTGEAAKVRGLGGPAHGGANEGERGPSSALRAHRWGGPVRLAGTGAASPASAARRDRDGRDLRGPRRRELGRPRAAIGRAVHGLPLPGRA